MRRLRAALLMMLALAPVTVFAAGPERQWQGQVPVELYVNVDDMSALWPFRDDETGAIPKVGEEHYEDYYARWQQLLSSVFEQLRPRVPRHYKIIPARTEELTAPLRIGVWVADLQTSCSAPTYYKYLWVQINQEQDGQFVTNWDDLGVKSETIIDMNLPKPKRDRADLESWTELWAQVPYLHVRAAAPGEHQHRAAPAPAGDPEPGAEAPETGS